MTPNPLKLNDYDKALRVSFAYFLKTGDASLYDYWFEEKMSYYRYAFSPMMSDEEYTRLEVY